MFRILSSYDDVMIVRIVFEQFDSFSDLVDMVMYYYMVFRGINSVMSLVSSVRNINYELIIVVVVFLFLVFIDDVGIFLIMLYFIIGIYINIISNQSYIFNLILKIVVGNKFLEVIVVVIDFFGV